MDLGEHDVHLYFSYPEQISDPELLSLYESLLNDEERAQMPRFYFEHHRHQYLVTRALIRSCLSRYYPDKPADWQFSKNAYGKPEVSHPDISSPIRFNLSHTDGLILCGLTRNRDIGVDVEDAQRSTRAALESLSSYFSAQEIADLALLPASEQKLRFFDYWTLKESYIKARGAGLAIPLDKFSFHFTENTLENFSIHPDLNDDANSWQFWRMSMAQRYRIAVAVNSNNRNFKTSAFLSIPLKSNVPFTPSFL